ncbi:hypothetical protein, partial [Niallia sp.]|uniref:hypothetical protein n=1 Tax=Niallia sp. TaxID=2837523 RepID=UPI0028991765
MKTWIRQNLYWMTPGVLIVLGLFLLFVQNFSKVTAQPEPDWSRGLLVGQSEVNTLPAIKETEDDNYLFSFFQENKLNTASMNKEFQIEEEKNYDIPVDKWTQIYQGKDQLIYFDYENIYDQNKTKLVADVEEFYPLDSSILYVKENKLFQLNPDTTKSSEVMEINLDKEKLSLEENEDGIHLLLFTKGKSNVDLTLYRLQEGKIGRLYETKIKVDPGKIVNGISFTFEEQKLALLLLEELELTQGQPEYFNYFAEAEITSTEQPEQYELTFQDPATENGKLTEISDVIFTYRDGKPRLLFKANGFTETKYNEKNGFNIYEAEIGEEGNTKTERRSNTAAISTIPQWLNEDTVVWMDLDGDGNKVYVSSNELTKINKQIKNTSEDWLQSIGKTFGMISTSFFAFALSFIWLLWPILFVIFMYVFFSRTVDYDRPWIFYTGIGIYLVAAVLFKDRFFVSNILSSAPGYLTFTGSTYFYLLLFAIIAYFLSMLTKRINEWTGA